jgi:hypothetical protein
MVQGMRGWDDSRNSTDGVEGVAHYRLTTTVVCHALFLIRSRVGVGLPHGDSRIVDSCTIDVCVDYGVGSSPGLRLGFPVAPACVCGSTWDTLGISVCMVTP